MKSAATVILLILFPAAVFGQSSPANRQRTDALQQKLGAFLGKWKISSTSADGAKTTADLECRWSPEGQFLICGQVIQAPDGEHRQLTVYSYDAQGGTYHYSTFAGPGAKASDGIVEIKGNIWTYKFSFERNGKTTQIRNTNEFTSPRTEVFKVVSSTDGGATWKPVLQGEAHKVGD